MSGGLTVSDVCRALQQQVALDKRASGYWKSRGSDLDAVDAWLDSFENWTGSTLFDDLRASLANSVTIQDHANV